MKKGISMLDTMRDFIQKVDDLGIDYMITGSYAMSAYGEIRMTRDIDIVVRLSIKDFKRFVDQFKSEYYIDENTVRHAIERRSMFNIVSQLHGGKIDCILKKDTDFGRTSFGRRYKETVTGIEFWTTTREDLIISKLSWAKDTHSEIQIRDVANLTAGEYDSAYVDQWLTRLGLLEIWAKVEQWKTQHSKQSDW